MKKPGWKYSLVIVLVGIIAFWAGLSIGVGIGERNAPSIEQLIQEEK